VSVWPLGQMLLQEDLDWVSEPEGHGWQVSRVSFAPVRNPFMVVLTVEPNPADADVEECGYTGKTLTYEELQDAMGRWGAWLTLHKGDVPQPPVVARFALCSVETAVVHLGTIAVGAVIASLGSSFGARELATQLDSCEAALVVTSVEFLPRLKEALEKLGRSIPVVIIGDAAASDTAGLHVLDTYEGIMKDDKFTPVAPVDIRSLVYRDFGSSYGMMCGISPGLLFGMCVVIKQLDNSTFIDDIEKLKINLVGIVPPNFPLLVRLGKERPDLQKTLRHVLVGGSAIAVMYEEAVYKLLPEVFLQKLYGSSEAGMISIDPHGGGKVGATGKVVAGVTVKVLDDEGKMLPANKEGILHVKTPGKMRGYRKNPTATRKVVDEEGWYNTEDIAVVDDDGYIRIVDRIKELIKMDDSYSASPTEIEHTILEVEGVQEVCVVGVPQADTGMDDIYAFVVKKPNLDSDVTEEEIKNYVAQQLNKKKQPNRECGYTGKTLTYEELQDAMGRWGAWLTLHKGDVPQPPVVAKFAMCSVDVAVVYLGTIAVGAVYTCLASIAGTRELATQLEGCGATLVVTSVEFLPRLKEALEKLGRSIPVVIIGDAAASDTAGLHVLDTYEGIMKDDKLTPATPVKLSGEETSHLLYTSGSTGLPKAVVHSHNSIIASVQSLLHPIYNQNQAASDISQTRVLLVRDFTLAYALLCAFLPGLAMGSCLIVKQLDEKTVTRDFEQFKVNTIAVVPPNLPPLIQMAQERPDLLHGLRSIIISGGSTPSPLMKAMKEFMPNVVIQKCRYHRLGSNQWRKLRIHRENLPKCVSLMKGYLNNATATSEVLDDDGWYNTGDVGLLNENGFIKVLDRVKELIKLKDSTSVLMEKLSSIYCIFHFKASPSELENTILELSGVREVCVVGLRRADTGMDDIYAFVVKKPNFVPDVTEDYIKNHVTTQLNQYKRPKKVIFLEKLPRNQSDKLHRVLLKSQASDLEKSN
ncbi:AMP-dependent synthetase/ligase, partial [Trinorchestia longiramus]